MCAFLKLSDVDSTASFDDISSFSFVIDVNDFTRLIVNALEPAVL